MWKRTLRDTAFPTFILVFWLVAAGYTVSRLAELPRAITLAARASA